MTLFPDNSGATFSECGLYRYRLWRIWDEGKPIMVFTLQNPSTANAIDNDPTITRCIGFARRDGFGGMIVLNVFGFRSTDERKLLDRQDPVGPLNHEHLQIIPSLPAGSRLVVAWGNRLGGQKLATAYQVASSICAGQNPYCLGTNKGGEPKHPLYVRADQPLIPWTPLSRPRTAEHEGVCFACGEDCRGGS